MGNETSVPDPGATPEELARAADALSGTSPPPVAPSAAEESSGGGDGAAASQQQQQQPGTIASIGSSSAAATASSGAQTPRQQQQGLSGAGGTAPLGAAEGVQTAAAAAAASGSMPAPAAAGVSSSSSQQLEKAKAMQQQMKARAAAMKVKGMTSASRIFQRTVIGGGGGGDVLTHHQQQEQQQARQQDQYYHPQQQQQQQPMQQSSGALGHGGAAAGSTEENGRTPSSLLPGQGGRGAVVDIMYATEYQQAHHQQEQQQQQQQYAAPGAAGAGDALNRQMQDMTLSSAAVQPPSTYSTATSSLSAATAATSASATVAAAGAKTTGLPNAEDEWQAAWEEDDESSGEEEEGDMVVGAVGGSAATGAGGGVPSGPLVAGDPAVPSIVTSDAGATMVGPPFRVGMDGGHSSLSPMNRVGSQSKLTQQQQQMQQIQQQKLLLQQQQQQMLLQQQQQQQQYASAGSMPPRQQQLLPPRTTVPLPPGPVGGPVVSSSIPGDVVAQQQAVGGALLDGIVWDTQVPSGAVTPEGSAGIMDDIPSEQMFTSMRVLGKGSFGKVVLVQKRTGKDRGGLFAMKILRKTHLVKRRQIERTKTERKVLSLVDHPFIMKLHFAFQSKEKLYLVLDYCPGGELFFHLSRYRRFPERVARFYAAELLLALGHLHRKGIIYRDLKPENVLLDADGHVKLGDFGLAKDNISHPCQGASSMCGTPEYMAPEVLSQAGHGFCVDYWGLGMLVYEMMTGLPPWYTTDRSKLFRRLKSAPLDIPTYFTMESASCVSALLERNPRKRLGAFGIKSAMQHEFFSDIDWRSLRDRRIQSPIRPCESWKANQQAQQNGGHEVNPSGDSPLPSAGRDNSGRHNQLSQNDLDVATANFDQTFTRMALETDDQGGGNDGDKATEDGEATEELNANTFAGFTFHEDDDVQMRNKDGGRMRGGPPPSQAYGGAPRR